MTTDLLFEIPAIHDEAKDSSGSSGRKEKGSDGMLSPDASNNSVLVKMAYELRAEHGLSNSSIARILRIEEDRLKVILHENERRQER
jgi:hypothetical protein